MLIRAAFERSPGNEFGSGKFGSPESSAALAANTFGYFLDRPAELPLIPGTEPCGWPASDVSIEQEVRFPWYPRGTQPWLDAFVETETHIIGIESKRFEPFRKKDAGSFSKTYLREVWGPAMGPFEAMRDGLKDGNFSFERLDAVQLVKHAFGLRNEGKRRKKLPVLVYLFAEPATWSNGRRVNAKHIATHREEAQRFSELVEGAEVFFRVCDYRSLLEAMSRSENDAVRGHAENVRAAFEL